jgi:hypothetical protein
VGLTPIPPPPRWTALDHAKHDYARGVIDLERFERQVEWLLRHNLGDSYEHLASW